MYLSLSLSSTTLLAAVPTATTTTATAPPAVVLLHVVVALLLVTMMVVLLLYLFYPALSSAYEARSSSSSSLLLPTPSLVRVTAHGMNNPPHSAALSSSSSSSPPVLSPPLLSVIVPAYNEEVRLPLMLEPAFTYLSNSTCDAFRSLRRHHRGGDDDESDVVVEWIVVSDGSTDGTERVYREFCSNLSDNTSHVDDGAVGGVTMLWKFVKLPKNRGKGMAVKAGVLSSTGLYCLMVDADGATQFDHLSRLAKALSTSPSPSSPPAAPITVWGSRAHLQDVPEKRNQRSLPRQLLMKAFHAFVKLICTRPNSPHVRDTQCGFKLFPRRHALTLFSNLHLRGWAFDIELLILSSFLNIGIEEVDVNWREVDGSKLSTSALNVILVSVSMLRDMICVRLCYELGLWTIRRDFDEAEGASDTNADDDSDYVRVSKMTALSEATTTANAAAPSLRSKSE